MVSNWQSRSLFSLVGALSFWGSLASAEDAPSSQARTDIGADSSVAGSKGGAEVGKADEPEASGPKVELPRLLEFVPATYPDAARAQALEADVPLELTIETDGSVGDARVKTSVGNGFDEAALEAALKLKFSPATVDGTPRRVKIAFLFPFRLEAPPAEPDPTREAEMGNESVRAAGDLGGRILLSGPDSPMPGVNVVLVDALGQPYSISADDDGRFRFRGLSPGPYTVKIEVEGFQPVQGIEEVTSGEITELTYRLAPKAAENEIVVQGERPARELTKRTLTRREIERIPGTGGDALRSIQSLPGVARPPGLAGLLIVRGSSPQDSAYFIDGTAVPLIYHFGGLSSVVPTELLDRIDFYPGNFSTRFGRAMGGIVDAGLRAPNTDCTGPYGALTDKKGCFHGMAQVDLIDMRLMLQGPLAKNWTFALAGRRSYIDTWLKPVLEGTGASVTSAPVYYDYQMIVDYRPNPGEKLSLRFYGSDDRFETIITTPSANQPGFGGNLRFGTGFTRAQILYQKELTDKLSLDAQVSVGTDSINFGLGGNLRFILDSIPIYLRSEFGYQILSTLRANVGLDFSATAFDVFVRAPPPDGPGNAGGPFGTRPSRESQSSALGFRPGWYGDLEWQPNRRLRFVPGLRVDYATDSNSVDVSPRLNARYALFLPEDVGPFGARKTTLKAGIGRYAQPPQFQETSDVFGTPGVKSNVAHHYSLGVEQQLTEQIDLTVEGFYKDMQNLVTQAPSGTGFVYANQGRGQVLGLETWLKYRADDRFFGWVAYTLSESLRTDCPTCSTHPFQFDQTHNLIVLGSYRLGRGWEFGARFRVVSGPLETPTSSSTPVPAIFAGDVGSYVALPGQPYSERMPVFHQLDLRIDKRWQFKSFRLNAYLDVQNVYNNPARESYVYNFDYSQKAYQTGLPILPSLGLRGDF